jgi:hypothetical protein
MTEPMMCWELNSLRKLRLRSLWRFGPSKPNRISLSGIKRILIVKSAGHSIFALTNVLLQLFGLSFVLPQLHHIEATVLGLQTRQQNLVLFVYPFCLALPNASVQRFFAARARHRRIERAVALSVDVRKVGFLH